MKIAYLGPLGTFSYLAAKEIFPNQKDDLFLAKDLIEEVFTAVANNKAKYGIVPIENSIAGSVGLTLDAFCNDQFKNLNIIQEYYLKINFNLLSQQQNLKKIDLIYAHYMAKEQCHSWLNKNLKNVRVRSVESNSKAAKLLKKDITKNKFNSAAISNYISAKKYDLKTLEKNIQDEKNSMTRFFVISKEATQPTGNDKTSILTTLKHVPGSLFGFLGALSKKNINMTRIESKVMKKSFWEYYFFVDFEGHKDDSNIKKAIAEMKKNCLTFKMLGSYPKGEAPWNN
jgi:chorismate mutase/prephenate dehydratase